MPIDSLYQATKSSIQQSIFQLQQKIRRVHLFYNKKNQLQLERELKDNLLEEERLLRQERQLQDVQRVYNDVAKYNNLLLQRTRHDPYVNSILYQSGLNEMGQVGYLDLKNEIRREAEHLEHLKRLERIQGQNLAVDARLASGYGGLRYDDSLMKYASPIRQISSNAISPNQSRGYSSKKSPTKINLIYKNLQYDQSFQDDSSTLLEKYNKGIRAQQYNREMQRLVEIEKRMQKIQPKSAAKSYYGPGNQSIVTPYQPRFDLHRQADKTRQKVPLVSDRGNAHEAQSTIVNDQHKGITQYKPSMNDDKKVEMFENAKIGEVINKKLEEKTDLRPSLGAERYSGLDRYKKNPQTRNSILKPTSLGRPQTSKPQNNTKRQASRSNLSGLSPLKSQRAITPRQPYQLYSKQKRPRSKSSKQQKPTNRHSNTLPVRKPNSRLLPLDPLTQKVLQDIVRKNVNDSIQSRMQLVNCVFRDIQMRKERNEIDNLQQRFQIEARARKEIKSMINNDPKILKKHKMVVE